MLSTREQKREGDQKGGLKVNGKSFFSKSKGTNVNFFTILNGGNQHYFVTRHALLNYYYYFISFQIEKKCYNTAIIK
jgi:hypothetical protein